MSLRDRNVLRDWQAGDEAAALRKRTAEMRRQKLAAEAHQAAEGQGQAGDISDVDTEPGGG